MHNKSAHLIAPGDYILDEVGRTLRVSEVSNVSRMFGRSGLLRIDHSGGVGYSVVHRDDPIRVRTTDE